VRELRRRRHLAHRAHGCERHALRSADLLHLRTGARAEPCLEQRHEDRLVALVAGHEWRNGGDLGQAHHLGDARLVARRTRDAGPAVRRRVQPPQRARGLARQIERNLRMAARVVTDERSADLERGDLERATAGPEHGERGRERVQAGELLDLVAPLRERRPVRIADVPHESRERGERE
jgi:hypothetical protein